MAKHKLQTLKPRIATHTFKRVEIQNLPDRRMTGRALQERRLRLWSSNPHCVGCGALTVFPYGFELDHKVPLFQGGADTDENCQILCVYQDELGRKAGCHATKTAVDLGFKK